LLFGCIVSATDPISVLAIFKDLRVNKRLSLLLEGESLLNDGTAVVLFGILLGAAAANKFNVAEGVADYFLAVVGGALLGVGLGYLAARITGTMDDPQIEITLTTILAYGSYLLAYHLHLSGVLATASAGLIFGDLGVKRGMSVRTQTAVQSFWEYISFVMNSIVFLLIGLEIHVHALLRDWAFVLLAIGAVLLGRLLSVYLLIPFSNRFSENIPFRWQLVAVWGGLRGALALALALSLNSEFPYRETILNLTFGVVVFSIIVQALTLKPLLRILRLADAEGSSQI
jgi:CPA1 family monovalent cation:H+ antiporter